MIYGLDLSLSSTGITIYDEEIDEVILVTHISTDDIRVNKKSGVKKETITGLKLKRIQDTLMKLREEYPPTEIAIERGFSRFNTATQMIYRVHGVANCVFSDVPQVYYPPKLIKEAIYNGSASKEELAKILTARLGLEFEVDDESDACAIMVTHLIKTGRLEWKGRASITKAQLKELKKKPA